LTNFALTRYRRSPAREPMLRLITFQLRHQGFCLPLTAARRVIVRPGHDPSLRLGLAQIDQTTIPLVDIASRIYQPAPALPQAEVALPHTVEQLPAQPAQTILVIDSPRLGLLGLLIDGTPSLKRVPPSAFTPVPASYPTLHRLRGIHTLVAAAANEPPLFLLDLEALFP
jgi:chemotaxis signal transduction protein